MTGPGLVLAVVLGAVFGSFATAAAWRLPRGEPLVVARSRCPRCGTTLQARDLVPVVSWLLLRGRCRACGAGIGWRYPVAELATAALFAVGWRLAADVREAALLAVVATGFVIAVLIAAPPGAGRERR